ncbi:MAG: T9SS type A sorting domain-containing protein [Bacteroidetes bacterium]|nr:MAG: T9SS type A sorting domain-containing protein [Bacteroidota bacterium]
MCRFVYIFTVNVFLLFSVFPGGGGTGLKAQTFYDSTHVPVFDTTKFCVPIFVSGLLNKIDTSFGLGSVCFNITHTFDADLVITLQSPDSSVITLAGGVGNSGKNFTNTCLAMNGDSGSIVTGKAPFTGTFIPQQSLNILNNGQDPNGTWKLCIHDTQMADTGSLHNFSITFVNNPPPDPPIPPVICNYCTCAGGADTCDLLPDMTASALCIQQYHSEYPGTITLANATPNIGRGPIEIHGIDSCFCDTVPVPCSTVCPTGKQFKRIVIQRIYQRQGGDTLSYYDHIAGKMASHPVHGHLHVDHWSDYSLRMATPNPDATVWPVLGTSVKQSFCLMNLSLCDSALGYCVDTNGNALGTADIPNAGFGLYSGCELDQGIYPGYFDVYDEPLNDPITFSNICNGNFYIVSITDPENNFLESDDSNNWAAVPVTLAMQTNPYGAASFNYSVNGSQINFTNTSPAGAGYLWNFGDGSWDTLFNPSHTYAAPGTYTVSLVSLNQCYTMNSQVVVITGINEYEQANLNLRVYPNPIAKNAVLMYYLPGNTNVTVELTDVSGRKIATIVNENQRQGVQKVPLKTDFLQTGVYFLHLIANGYGNTAAKIIKTKE